jgi:hypothetical protein
MGTRTFREKVRVPFSPCPLFADVNVEATWPDGRRSPRAGGGPGPPGTGADAYLVIERPDAPPPGALLSADPRTVAAYIARAGSLGTHTFVSPFLNERQVPGSPERPDNCYNRR